MRQLNRSITWAVALAAVLAGRAQAAGPTARDTEVVSRVIDTWLKGAGRDFDAADVALQWGVTLDGFSLIEAAVDREDLPAESRAWLKQYVERERPRHEARVRKEIRQLAANVWSQRTAVEAYEKFGRHDARWDEAARAGIRQFLKPDHQKALEAFSGAMGTGCDDPFIGYLRARSMGILGMDAREVKETLYTAAMAMGKTNYPPFRREVAAQMAFKSAWEFELPRLGAGLEPAADFSEKYDALTKLMVDIWPELVAEQGVPERQLADLGSQIVEMELGEGIDRKPLYDGVYEPLAKAFPKSTVTALIKGRFYLKYAWDGRGGGYANTVTPEKWKLFHERLVEAEAALEMAWQRDPTNPDAPVSMMKVALGENWPQEKMDVWFQRAIKVDPDDQAAYDAKMYYLEPKWHGSPEAMLAFGRECRDMRNLYGKTPFVLIRAHAVLASYGDVDAYFQTPVVWEDIRSVYEPLLRGLPGNYVHRSAYAFWACRTQHWDVADAQFEAMGDHVVASQFGSRPEMERMRAMAKKKGSN